MPAGLLGVPLLLLLHAPVLTGPPGTPDGTASTPLTAGPVQDATAPERAPAPDQDPGLEQEGIPEEARGIHERIARLLAEYREMDGLRDVHIRLGASGVIHLSGTALSAEDRERAGRLAGDLEGVERVENRIEVSDRVRWEEGVGEAGEPDRGVGTAPDALDEAPPAGRGVLWTMLVVLGVVVAVTVLFVRMRRLRSDL